MTSVRAFILVGLAVFVLRPGVAAAGAGPPTFAWPVEGKVIDEDDGRRSPARLEGIDILVPEGTDVRASRSGTVIYAGNGLRSFGNLILIRHEDHWVTVYGNNGELFVNRGEEVLTGDVIARSGRSGFVSRPQLHFQIRNKQSPWNPAQYLPLLQPQAPPAP